jgi:hypothetical protein
VRGKRLAAKVIGKVAAGIHEITAGGSYRRIAARYDFCGFRRIYQLHIRKTGGTSLNHMFLKLADADADGLYSQLANTPGNRVCRNGLIYVGWNARLIDQGYYFYGFSHRPLHELRLPPDTFTVSCFWDPVERVVSHFNMLTHYRDSRIDHPCMAVEGKWLGNSFDEFLDRIPKTHLLNQLYMFSAVLDVDEATANVRGLSHYFFTDDFFEGVQQLNAKTGLHLAPTHVRKRAVSSQISDTSLRRLKEMLADEYRLLAYIR